MKVKLLKFTSDPQLVCAVAASTSFGERGPIEQLVKITKKRAEKNIKRVMAHGHHSVIEHASFTFALEDVSRVLEIQLVRHRIASYTIKSGRYNKSHCDVVIPPNIADNRETLKKVNEFIMTNTKLIKELLDMGMSYEDVRFFSPQGIKTNIVVTMNARELHHFFNLRCCARAQWEIRSVATEMLRQVKRVAPTIFETAGPSCVKLGHCPEGSLKPKTCNIKKIRKKFMEM